MHEEDRKLVTRGLNLIEIYIKGKLISTISISLITAGISILGISNVVPYIAVVLRPELSDSINTQNNTFMVIALLLILIGCLIPIFVQIFYYYKSLYKKDLEKINKITGLYDSYSFDYDMLHIINNLSMFDYQIEKIEKFFSNILSDDFFFYDKKANESMKKLGNELSAFNSSMALKISPASHLVNLYNIPKNVYNSIEFESIREAIVADCNKVRKSYVDMKLNLDRLESKNLLRYFV